jgi:hypothetical protein
MEREVMTGYQAATISREKRARVRQKVVQLSTGTSEWCHRKPDTRVWFLVSLCHLLLRGRLSVHSISLCRYVWIPRLVHSLPVTQTNELPRKIVPATVWRDWRKPMKTSPVRKATLWPRFEPDIWRIHSWKANHSIEAICDDDDRDDG